MISRFVIQKHFSGSRNFVRQPRRMALLLLVRGGDILTGSEARIWKKGTVHCTQLSSGWSGGESLSAYQVSRRIKHLERALWTAKIPFSLWAFRIVACRELSLISVSRSPSSCKDRSEMGRPTEDLCRFRQNGVPRDHLNVCNVTVLRNSNVQMHCAAHEFGGTPLMMDLLRRLAKDPDLRVRERASELLASFEYGLRRGEELYAVAR